MFRSSRRASRRGTARLIRTPGPRRLTVTGTPVRACSSPDASSARPPERRPAANTLPPAETITRRRSSLTTTAANRARVVWPRRRIRRASYVPSVRSAAVIARRWPRQTWLKRPTRRMVRAVPLETSPAAWGTSPPLTYPTRGYTPSQPGIRAGTGANANRNRERRRPWPCRIGRGCAPGRTWRRRPRGRGGDRPPVRSGQRHPGRRRVSDTRRVPMGRAHERGDAAFGPVVARAALWAPSAADLQSVWGSRAAGRGVCSHHRRNGRGPRGRSIARRAARSDAVRPGRVRPGRVPRGRSDRVQLPGDAPPGSERALRGRRRSDRRARAADAARDRQRLRADGPDRARRLGDGRAPHRGDPGTAAALGAALPRACRGD